MELSLRDLEAQCTAYDRVMHEVRTTLAAERVTHTSPDGRVTVTVDGLGDIAGLELVRGAVRRGGDLGPTVLVAVNTARAKAAQLRGKLVGRALADAPDLTFVVGAEA